MIHTKVRGIQPDDTPQKHTDYQYIQPMTLHIQRKAQHSTKYRGYYQFTALVHPGDYKLNTKNTKG